jgi:uncharacterized protein (TIGR00255 family)
MAARPRRAARPLASMTGYGRGRAANRHAEAEAELRSVNSKSLHLAVRLPPDRLEWEGEVEALLRGRFERGSLQGGVKLRWRKAPAPVLDHDALRRHLREWRAAQTELGLGAEPPALAALMGLPGAWRPAEEAAAATAAARKAVLAALAAAADALDAARAREGARLGKELLALVAQLEAGLAQVRARLPQARVEADARLRERVARALAAAGIAEPPELAREIVMAAEKGDVAEECARLAIHLARLRELLQGGGPIGRELEFLLQECHREVTTLGSKTTDAPAVATILAMKLAVQQLKEQAANVE